MMKRVVRRVASDVSEETQTAIAALIVYGLLLFCTGTLSIFVSAKLTGSTAPKCEGCKPEPFDNVSLNLVIQCIGEMLCLLFYYLDRWCFGKDRGWLRFESLGDPELPAARWTHWLWIGIMDVVSTYAIFVAQTSLNTITVQMIRCSSLFLCAIGCIILFKRDFRVASWLGLLLISIGQILFSIDATLGRNSASAHYKNPGLGFLMVAIGVIFGSMFYVCEERLWLKQHFNPVKAVGTYGTIATILSIILLSITDLVGWEKYSQTIYQFSSSPRVIVLSVVFIVIVSILNVAALCATAVGSALFTATILSARQITSWTLGLFDRSTSLELFSLLGVSFMGFGFIFYTGLASHFFPERVRRKLNSNLQLQCVLLWDDEEFAHPESLESDSISSTAADADTPRLTAEERQLLPTVLGNVNVTKCADDFYQHDQLKDNQWVFVEKEFEVALPAEPAASARAPLERD